MKNHVKVYLKHLKVSQGEYLACEYCNAHGSDIHHIKFRSQGGGDNIENLCCLCRECHFKVHFGTGISAEKLREVHYRFLGIEKATIADDEQQ